MFFQILITGGLIAGYLLLFSITRRLLKRLGEKKNVPNTRIVYVEKYFNGIFVAVLVVAVFVTWSIDYRGLLVFASSFFAVVGVALFAQWSILSNVTSSVIIFFTFPAKIGDKIKIMDADDTVVGEICEITLFQILLKDADGNMVSYPNSLVLQKPVVKITKLESA